MDRDAETQPNTWLTKYITSIQAPSKIILTYLFKSEKRILINPPPPTDHVPESIYKQLSPELQRMVDIDVSRPVANDFYE